ncbi:LysM domain-containing protein [Streptomyces sp. NPDC006265]|uniref:LysM peptidoglycan-binding domain-containing protein n=1 Tax=Streptomyces sp. NPDC006265 TaxID=3156740 RepID=UPI0033A938B1
MVKGGDTLIKIASMHHVTLDQILEWNPEIENPDMSADRVAARPCTGSSSRSRVPTSSSPP